MSKDMLTCIYKVSGDITREISLFYEFDLEGDITT